MSSKKQQTTALITQYLKYNIEYVFTNLFRLRNIGKKSGKFRQDCDMRWIISKYVSTFKQYMYLTNDTGFKSNAGDWVLQTVKGSGLRSKTTRNNLKSRDCG